MNTPKSRCRHGHIASDCPRCRMGAFGVLPTSPTLPSPRRERFSAQPRSARRGTDAKPRRGLPDRLFVCDACYTAHRHQEPRNPLHTACNQRLDQRAEVVTTL